MASRQLGHIITSSVTLFIIHAWCWKFNEQQVEFLIFAPKLTEIRAWISDYTNGFMWDVITHPCPNFNGALSKPSLELGVRNYNVHPIL